MIIGITGGIGSGKSVIARQLRKMGYEVYDTDSEAKRIIMEDAHVRAQITALFGSQAYKDGVYQTAFVAQQVFNANSPSPNSLIASSPNPLLARLNAIVHPAVRQDILHRFTSPPFRGESEGGLFFIECAILYQAGIDALCDKVVAVTAPEDIRLSRVIARDRSDIDKVRARMRAQSTEEDLRRADIVIHNDGTTPIPQLCEDLLQSIQ
jgi:dephospho-CoA kinase